MSENRLLSATAPPLGDARRAKLAAVIGGAPAATVTALLREAGAFAPLAPLIDETGAPGTIASSALVELVRAALAPPVAPGVVDALVTVVLGDRAGALVGLDALARAAARSSGDPDVRLLALTIETLRPALAARDDPAIVSAVVARAAEAGSPVVERASRLLAATGDDLDRIAAALISVLHKSGAGVGDVKTLLSAAFALAAGSALRTPGPAEVVTAEDWRALATSADARAEAWRAARAELGGALGLSRATQADRAAIEAAKPLTRRLGEAGRAALSPLFGDPGRLEPATCAATLAAAEFVAKADSWAETLGAADTLANVHARIARALRDPDIQGALDVLSALARLDPEAATLRAEAAADVGARLLDPLASRGLTRRLRAAVGRPDLDSVVLSLLDPITTAPGTASVAHRASAAAVDSVWRWATSTGAPAVIADADARLGRLVKARDLRGMRNLAVEVRLAIARALEAGHSDREPQLAEVIRALGPAGPEEVLAIGRLLALADLLDARLGDWPARVPSLDAAKLDVARDLVDAAVARSSDAGVGVLVYVMYRLRRPWEVLDLLQRVTRQKSDVVLERTEYAVVGHYLLDEAEAALSAFVWPRDGVLDVAQTIGHLAVFGGILSSFMGAFQLRKDGEWGKRCAALARKGAEKLAALCDASVEAIEAATPRAASPRSGWRPSLDPDADPRIFARAVAGVGFLRRTMLHDERAAFAAARAKALAAVEARLTPYEDALLDALHEGDPLAPRQLTTFAQIVEAFYGHERAVVLRRRAAAA